ncbi:hypothetical protein [Massilia sp. CCM 8734]|uniref:hypothetical protein n=1 Tax=Massilia sp. CCM 8734 TaxID=2609283 RepID=UPI001422440D|nr:hypothetical protein [Massilia sp. CCM 8734]NHZ97594.1 hypothetical protein [Massilia sp. CCM 8734]
MLILQVLNNRKIPYVVHAEYSASKSHHGGHLSSVYPGGRFMGFTFETLCEMGTGEHELAALDPYDFKNTGIRPTYQSALEEMDEKFKFILFGYQVGAYTSLEVLAYAEDISAARRASAT